MRLFFDNDTPEELEKSGGVWLCETFEWVRIDTGIPGHRLQSVFLDGPKPRPVDWSTRSQAHTFSLDGVGEYRLRWEDGGRKGIETIEVAPSALGEAGVRDMLREIGEMALDLAALSLTQHEVRFGAESGWETAGVTAPKTGSNPQTDWLTRLIERIEAEIEMVRRAPCKDLTNRPGSVSVERSIVPSHLILRKTRPDVRRTHGVTRAETFDTPENRWLKHLLSNVLPSLIATKRHRADKGSLLYDEVARTEASDRAEERVDTLEERLKTLQSTPLLKDVKESYVMPRPTKRLMVRPGYAGIYRAYADQDGDEAIERLERLQDTVSQFTRSGVRKLSNIYELWCLFRLYSDLRTNLGLSPVGDEPQDVVEIVDGRLEFGSKRSFDLEKPFAGSELKVTLDYDRKRERKGGGYYRPDFVFTIKSPARKLGGGSMVVILDAKYHEYDRLGRKQASNARFSLRKDIEETALNKYARGLEDPVDASFILHPCEGDQTRGERRDLYEWRGERPYNEFLKPETEGLDHPWLQHPGHQIGALLYKPGDVAARARLLTIMFHHLFGLTSLCLNCGRELTDRKEYIDRGGLQDPINPRSRFHATCSICGQHWDISYCWGGRSTKDEVSLHTGGGEFEHIYVDRERPRRNSRVVQPCGQTGSSAIHHYEGKTLICPLCQTPGPQVG